MQAVSGQVEVYNSFLGFGSTQFQEKELFQLGNADQMMKLKEIIKEVNQKMTSSGFASNILMATAFRLIVYGLAIASAATMIVGFLLLGLPQTINYRQQVVPSILLVSFGLAFILRVIVYTTADWREKNKCFEKLESCLKRLNQEYLSDSINARVLCEKGIMAPKYRLVITCTSKPPVGSTPLPSFMKFGENAPIGNQDVIVQIPPAAVGISHGEGEDYMAPPEYEK